MTELLKNDNSIYLFYSKLSNSSRANILEDFLAMFSSHKFEYIAVILKNAPKEELLSLAEEFEKRILDLNNGEVVTKYNKKYNLDSLVGFCPVIVSEPDGYNEDSLRKSMSCLRSFCEKSIYIVVDYKNQISLSNRFGFYSVDVGYFLNQSSS